MANTKPGMKREAMRKRVLHASARLFLENGYTATTLKQIADESKMNIGSLMNIFGSKEDVLVELVRNVLELQYQSTYKYLPQAGTEGHIFFAAETTLQLYMTEHSEAMQEVYAVAYSSPKTSALIHETVTQKLMSIFKNQLPHLVLCKRL